MIQKLAYAIQMSVDIPDEEQNKAAHISLLFSKIENKIDLFLDHLKIIYNPFSKSQNVDSNKLYEKRFLFARFNKKMQENYQNIKKSSLLAIKELNYFDQDTHIHEVINSFQNSMEEIDKLFNELSSHLEDVKSNNFIAELLKKIELIESKFKLLKDFINERIISHIEKNIINMDWFQKNNKELKIEIEKQEPFFKQLFEERQKILDGIEDGKTPSVLQNSQILNPVQQHQSIYKSTDVAQPKQEE